MLEYSSLLLFLYFYVSCSLPDALYMFLIVLLFIPSVPDGPRFILLIPPLCCSSVPRVLSLHLSCCLCPPVSLFLFNFILVIVVLCVLYNVCVLSESSRVPYCVVSHFPVFSQDFWNLDSLESCVFMDLAVLVWE